MKMSFSLCLFIFINHVLIFYSFVVLVETPSQCNSLLSHFDTNQNCDFSDLYVPVSRTVSVFINQECGRCYYFFSIPSQIKLIVFFGVFKHWMDYFILAETSNICCLE